MCWKDDSHWIRGSNVNSILEGHQQGVWWRMAGRFLKRVFWTLSYPWIGLGLFADWTWNMFESKAGSGQPTLARETELSVCPSTWYRVKVRPIHIDNLDIDSWVGNPKRVETTSLFAHYSIHSTWSKGSSGGARHLYDSISPTTSPQVFSLQSSQWKGYKFVRYIYSLR